MAKYKIRINDIDNVRELLQISYQTCDEQLVQAQNEITKMASATRLNEATMQEKEQYAKAINNYLTIKDKAISRKLEIAKLLTEVYKHNGDVNSTLNDAQSTKNMSFDFSKIKEIVNDNYEDKKQTQTIKLNPHQ